MKLPHITIVEIQCVEFTFDVTYFHRVVDN